MSTNALERQPVLEQVHRLFWAVDCRQWDVVADACAPDLTADWDGLGPGPFADSVCAMLAGVTTLHQCTNEVVSVVGRLATVDVMVAARHRRPTLRGSDMFVRLSTDSIRLRQGGNGWIVTNLARIERMAEGNPAVLGGAGCPEPPAPTEMLAPEPPARTDAERLARIADHQAIHDLMMRFGRGLDTKDWALYRSCLADQLLVDFAQTTGRAARAVPADKFVEFVRMRQRGHAAFHQYSNFQASVDGQRARCILYLAARHRAADARGDPLNVFIGWYDNEFVRGHDGWRISKLRHPLQWVEGNAAIKDASDPEAEALGQELFR